MYIIDGPTKRGGTSLQVSEIKNIASCNEKPVEVLGFLPAQQGKIYQIDVHKFAHVMTAQLW